MPDHLRAVEQSCQVRLAPTARSLWRLAKCVCRECWEDRIPTVAGGVTFFLLLALFPALSAIVSLLGIFAHRAQINHDIDLISGFLPRGAITVLRDDLHRLVAKPRATLNIAFLTSFGVALWSASGGYKALVDGLDIAFEVPETRSFFRQTFAALLFTLTTICVAALIVGLALAVPELDTRSLLLNAVLHLFWWCTAFVISCLAISAVYYFAPDLQGVNWRWMSWGSTTSSFLWIVSTQILAWIGQLRSLDRIYGDIAAAVALLASIWLSLVFLLVGAEIDCELKRRSYGGVGTPP